MEQDRHGICDGCDRQKKLVLVNGRGLCVNCETLWGEAQKAMADDIIDMLQRHTKHARFTYGTRERLSTGFLFEIKKYLKEVVKDDQRI